MKWPSFFPLTSLIAFWCCLICLFIFLLTLPTVWPDWIAIWAIFKACLIFLLIFLHILLTVCQDWATYCNLGNFYSMWQQFCGSNLRYFRRGFQNGFNYLVKTFSAIFGFITQNVWSSRRLQIFKKSLIKVDRLKGLKCLVEKPTNLKKYLQSWSQMFSRETQKFRNDKTFFVANCSFEPKLLLPVSTIAAHTHPPSQAVWTDWAIFKDFGDEFSFKSSPIYMVKLGLFLKTSLFN